MESMKKRNGLPLWPKIILLFIFLIGKSIYSREFHQIVSSGVGVLNVAVTENGSKIQQTDTSVIVTGQDNLSSFSSSIISFSLMWEFWTEAKYSYLIKAFAPLMSPNGNGVFLGAIGINFYLTKLSSKYTFKNSGNEVLMVPSLKFYWGIDLGMGYLIYNTQSAIKSDIFLDTGVRFGIGYGLGEKWGILGEAGIGRSTGVATSGIIIKAFVGTTYYL